MGERERERRKEREREKGRIEMDTHFVYAAFVHLSIRPAASSFPLHSAGLCPSVHHARHAGLARGSQGKVACACCHPQKKALKINKTKVKTTPK